MALFQLQAPQDNSLYRAALAQQLIGGGLAQFGQHRAQQQAAQAEATQRQAMGQLLTGRQAALDPGVASLDIMQTQGGPGFQTSVPGFLQTGQLTPEMAQAYMLKGGDPSALAQFMPKQAEAPKLQHIDWIEGDQRKFGLLNPTTGEITPQEGAGGAAFAQPASTSIELKVPPQYPSAPAGMHYSGDFSRPETVRLQPTPGYQPDVEGGAAAAQALVPGSLSEVPQLEASLFPQGQFDRMAAGTMNAPLIGAVPNSAGEGLRAAMQAGTMAILRHESGGAITDQEIANKLETYMPSPIDTPDVARQKFERYKRDLESTLKTATRGRGEPPQVPPSQTAPTQPGLADQLIQQGMGAVEQMMGGQSAPAGNVPTIQDQAAYDALPPGAKYTVGDGVTRTKGAR